MKKFILLTGIIAIFMSCKNNNQLSDAYGNFEANEIIIASEANGKIIEFYIKEGQILEENQLVGIIDSTQLYLKKKQIMSQFGLINAKQEGVEAQIEVQLKQKENFQVELKRVEKLLKDGAATSKQLDDLKGNLELIEKQIKATRTQFDVIKNEKSALYIQLEQIKDQLDKCIIITPLKGTVLEKYVEKNELVGLGRNLYKIANLDEMELRVYISGTQLPHVKIGQKAKVLIDEDKKTNKELEGIVSWISETAEFTPKIIQTKEERVKLVYAVKVRVKNDGSLKIGMPGEVLFCNQ